MKHVLLNKFPTNFWMMLLNNFFDKNFCQKNLKWYIFLMNVFPKDFLEKKKYIQYTKQ